MLDTRLSLEQRQERLQTEYDLICNMLVHCLISNEMGGYNEYLWRKHEVERVAECIGIDLLKERDIKRLIEFAKREKTKGAI